MEKKSTKIWITFLWLPFVILLLTSLLQLMAGFVFSSVDGVRSVPVFLNIISVLLGIFAVFGILLMPVWIVMLVKATNYNKSLSESLNQSQNDNSPLAK